MSHVRLMLEYFHPWPNSAGFYVARRRGYYAEAGIDLEITLFDPERGDTLAHLLREEVTFGVFPSNRLLVRREEGGRVVGIAAINHGGLETIQTIRASGIRRPADLSGRRVAFGPTPRGKAMVRHLVQADGGDPDSIVIVDNRHRELSVDDIQGGAADATFGGYWAWDALFGTLPEEERITWRVDDIGAPPYHSYLLGTLDTTINRDPGLVRAFLSATARGYLDALADPGHALAVLERITPYFPVQILRRSLQLIGSSWIHAGRWGEQRPELLRPYANWLAGQGILRRPDDWQYAVTDRFLPPLPERTVGTPDRAA